MTREGIYREALETLASPNRAARPTGQDALDMAAFARQALTSAERYAADGREQAAFDREVRQA